MTDHRFELSKEQTLRLVELHDVLEKSLTKDDSADFGFPTAQYRSCAECNFGCAISCTHTCTATCNGNCAGECGGCSGTAEIICAECGGNCVDVCSEGCGLEQRS